MKYRMGFVTNSSSSSYTVAFKKPEDTENLPKFVRKLYEAFIGGLGTIIENEEQLNAHFTEYYCYGDKTLEQVLEKDGYEKKRYDDWLKKIRDGFTIADMSIDQNDETLVEMLYKMKDDESFFIIEED